MPGLSIAKRAFRPFASSKVDDSIHICGLKQNGEQQVQISNGIWRSWELLSKNYSQLCIKSATSSENQVSKCEEETKENQTKKSEENDISGSMNTKRKRKVRSVSLSTDVEKKTSSNTHSFSKNESGSENSVSSDEFIPKRINNIISKSTGAIRKYGNDSRQEVQMRNEDIDELICYGEGTSNSANIDHVTVPGKRISQPSRTEIRKKPDTTLKKNPVSKYKDGAEPEKSSNRPGRGELLWKKIGIAQKSNPVPKYKGKTQEPKNMTSLLQFNHNLGKDVLDNGIALLSAKLQVNTEKDRLKTFKNWPNKRIEPKKLAEAGFFYCGRADIVECFVCGIKGHNWVENDKPMDDHMRWNKDCPFVRENATEHDNVRASASTQGRDICGNLGVEILPNSRPEDTTESETSLEKLGIQKAKGPSHPDQIIYETRLATFANWPKSMKQKPPELANAGFYYLGVGDQTLCFYCGGGLKDWDEDDDPWEQHALWFPKCNYLLLKKSPAFVEAVHEKHKGTLSTKKEEPQAGCSSNCDTKETCSGLSSSTEERKTEDSSTLCKICFKNELGVVFLPCGHMVACTDCASALKECAVCRKNIQATVRAFLS